MRDPRIDPIAGDVVTRKGVTRTVTDLLSSDILGLSRRFYVYFRHQKRGHNERGGVLSLAEWRERTADATIVKRGDDPHTVTQADRDKLREAIWEVAREHTRHWIDRDRELHDVLLGMACAMQDAIDDAAHTE